MTDAETVASGAATLWQGAAEAVRRAIVSGELQDGVRVSEASLAETLGVSRAPVRDDTTAYAGADLALHRALVRAARDRWLLSAWENLAPVIAATLALGANPSSRAAQEIAAGHGDILQLLLEGDVLSAEATLRRHLRGAVDHLLTRFQAPDP